MSYRALFVADVHLSNTLPFAQRDPETLITDRFHDVLSVIEQMCVYGCENNIQDVWILGDLLDRRLLDAVTLKLATDALVGHADGLAGHHRVYITGGNHEAGDADCRHYTVEMFQTLASDIRVITGNGAWVEPVPGFNVFAMPYLPHKRAEAILGELAPANLILLHQTIKGGCVGGWTSPEGIDPTNLPAPVTIAGHFHSPQDVIPSVSYLGAPLQHNFGDRGDNRGFWDITFQEDGRTDRKMVPIEGAPRFHDIQWIISGPMPDVTAIGPKDYANIRIVGSKAEVDKSWKAVEAHINGFTADSGARLIRPIAETDATPAKQRLAFSETERPSWEQVVGRYLGALDCTGLNRDRLADLAKEFIADAEA